MTAEEIVNKILSDPLTVNMEEYVKLIEDYAKDYQLNKSNQNILILGRDKGKTEALSERLMTIMEHFKKDNIAIVVDDESKVNGLSGRIANHTDGTIIEHAKRIFEIKNLEYAPEVYLDDFKTKKVSQKQIRKELNRNFKRKKR